MKRSRLFNGLLILVITMACLCGCGQDNSADTTESTEEGESLTATDTGLTNVDIIDPDAAATIIYTGDVHSIIDNDSNDTDNSLTYANVAAIKKHCLSISSNVLLVDTGDFAQGSAYGSLDKASTIVDIMNECGYDCATFGSYEFNYGCDRAFEIFDSCNFPIVSSNFSYVDDVAPVLEPYRVFELDGIKIAFVGINTPEILNKSAPAYFMDESESHYLYTFNGSGDGELFYSFIQEAIDMASEEADLVIALGELGNEDYDSPFSVQDVIANTSGLTAIIGGYTHDCIEEEYYTDKDGRQVLYTEPGAYLEAVGILSIDDSGQASAGLLYDYDESDSAIADITNSWKDSVNEQLGITIATDDAPLYYNDPDTGDRLVRRCETNLGDFIADSYYHHFNNVEGIQCDIAIVNGGAMRADIPAGDVSYSTCKTTCPFESVLCLVEMSGQDVLDALEWGARYIGTYDDDGKAKENAGLLQIAGATYDVAANVESTVTQDADGVWSGPPSGEYKVRNVQVFNRDTGSYEPLDLEATYRVAGVNYILTTLGDGFAMFDDSVVYKDYVGQEYMIMAEYLQLFGRDDELVAHLKTTYSPLHLLEGYKLDYENINGSGRINIVEE